LRTYSLTRTSLSKRMGNSPLGEGPLNNCGKHGVGGVLLFWDLLLANRTFGRLAEQLIKAAGKEKP